IKLTCPGVPDLYQGCEHWDLSLVDPDNRRPVDFTARGAGLNGADNDWPDLLERWPTGQVKLALTHRLLRLRQEMPEIFTSGTYAPLDAGGACTGHVIAYERRRGMRRIAVVTGRCLAKLCEGDPDAYAASRWQDGWVKVPG